jgi:AcrR family transcriptional regulator
MARRRFANLDRETRRRILETAAEEFAARGFDGTSLNRLIERLGLSKGSFYYYFDDKADLFSSVADHAWQTFLPTDRIDLDVLDADTYWSALGEIMREAHATARANPWLVGFTRMIYDPPDVPEIRRSLAERFTEARDLQTELIRRGQELGVVRDDLPVALLQTLLVGADEAADRWFVEHWNRLPEKDTERLFQEVLAILRRMMEPPVRREDAP